MRVIKSIPITFETFLISVLVQSETVLFVIRRMNLRVCTRNYDYNEDRGYYRDSSFSIFLFDAR